MGQMAAKESKEWEKSEFDQMKQEERRGMARMKEEDRVRQANPDPIFATQPLFPVWGVPQPKCCCGATEQRSGVGGTDRSF